MFNNAVFGHKGFYHENCLKKKKSVKSTGFEIMTVLLFFDKILVTCGNKLNSFNEFTNNLISNKKQHYIESIPIQLIHVCKQLQDSRFVYKRMNSYPCNSLVVQYSIFKF